MIGCKYRDEVRRRGGRLGAFAVAATLVATLFSFVEPCTTAKAAPSSQSTPPVPLINTVTGFPSQQGGAVSPQQIPIPVPQAPYGVTIQDSNKSDIQAFVADPINHLVRNVVIGGDGLSFLNTAKERAFLGDGGYGNGPDAGAPSDSQVSGPYATDVDSAGNVYVADTFADVVRVVGRDDNGQPVVDAAIAGTPGHFGYSGDGGPAVSATMNSPYGIAVDSNNQIVYIADTLNNVIRAVSIGAASPPIVTVAGTGVAGFNGDGQATSTQLSKPRGITFGRDGKLYVADTGNNRIRVFDPAAKSLATLAGDGRPAFQDGSGTVAQFNEPAGVSYDASTSTVLVADTGNDVIRRISGAPRAATVATVAGTPATPGYSGDCPLPTATCTTLATKARLDAPFGVAALPSGGFTAGGFLVADTLNYAVRLVDSSAVTTAQIHTIAGNGSKSFSGDGAPESAAELSGVSSIVQVVKVPYPIVFADPYNNRVRAVNARGNIVTLAGNGSGGFSGDGGSAGKAQLDSPFGVAVSANGGAEIVYIADTFNSRIRRVDTQTGLITTVAGTGTPGFSGDGGPAPQAMLSFPIGLAIDAAGDLYVADSYNARIRRIDGANAADGSRHIITVAGTGQLGYQPADEGGQAAAAHLYFPYGVAIAPGGSLLVADSFDNRILSVALNTSAVYTVAGDGTEGFSGDGSPATSASLNHPWSIAAGGSAFGPLVIADYLNNRLRVVSATGSISTLSGTGPPGDLGDLGLAQRGELSGPRGVAITPSRGVLAADSMSDKVRLIDFAGFTLSGDGLFPAVSTTHTFTVTNTGSMPLVIGVSISSNPPTVFNLPTSGNSCRALAAQTSCTADVAFNLDATNLDAAIGTLKADAGPVVGSLTVALSWTGPN